MTINDGPTSCVVPHQCCSHRDKCKNSCNSRFIQEPPVKDTQSIPCKTMTHLEERDFSPPSELHNAPPSDLHNAPPGQWELQYCKWSGWTWVQKKNKEAVCPCPAKSNTTQIAEPPPRRRLSEESARARSRSMTPEPEDDGCFGCFRKKKPPTVYQAPHTAAEPILEEPPAEKVSVKELKKDTNEKDTRHCCCCCCCCNHVVCCCCCCCQESPQDEKCCRNMETQTCCQVKDCSTKMSEMQISKSSPVPQKTAGFCCNNRNRCCRRTICCPCVQHVCCPCKNNVQKYRTRGNKGNQQKQEHCCEDSDSATDDKVVNYFLLNNALKSDVPNLPQRYTTYNYSTLQKTLDILLKNNVNILQAFDDKKELKNELKPPTGGSSQHTITSLPIRHTMERKDPEHSKILTAVCDAIFSDQKEDFRISSPMNTPRSNDFKEMKRSNNIFSSRRLLKSMLSDLHISNSSKSSSNMSIQKDIGVQVGRNDKPCGSFCQHKRSLLKLLRTRSKILAASRKIGSRRHTCAYSRNQDMGGHTSGSGPKQEEKTLGEASTCGTSNARPPSKIPRIQIVCKGRQAAMEREISNLEQIEHLLNSIEYVSSPTNPPLPTFTDSDTMLNADETRRMDENFHRRL